MRLHFLGANRQVTGSRYLLEAGGLNLLIDCGMFQERPFLDRNRATLPIAPDQIDYLLLTHAHLDHCGLIPRIVREGFSAPILATSASIELTRIVLEDSAKIQEEDAAYAQKRQAQQSGGAAPDSSADSLLYNHEDARRAFELFKEVPFDEPVSLNGSVSVLYRFAGHILGSASIEVICTENGRARRIVFSGDLGQWDRPLLQDPAPFESADYVVMESTYGDRIHDETANVQDRMREIIANAVNRGGNVIMPTFALDRPQEVMFYLNRLIEDHRVEPVLVFLDSPMAVDVHRVFAKHADELDAQTQSMLAAGDDPLEFPGLKLARSSAESKAINVIKGTCIIMAGSGMCTGGRIKHHLKHNIARPESTILFVGYQGEGTLGREILDGAKSVRIFGEQFPVRARIEQISGLSAHGDQRDLLRWLGAFTTQPRTLFLTHGEEQVALHLAEKISADRRWNVTVPHYGDVVSLDASV